MANAWRSWGFWVVPAYGGCPCRLKSVLGGRRLLPPRWTKMIGALGYGPNVVGLGRNADLRQYVGVRGRGGGLDPRGDPPAPPAGAAGAGPPREAPVLAELVPRVRDVRRPRDGREAVKDR